eukprot:1522286-Amphidinium_carterae.2
MLTDRGAVQTSRRSSKLAAIGKFAWQSMGAATAQRTRGYSQRPPAQTLSTGGNESMQCR